MHWLLVLIAVLAIQADCCSMPRGWKQKSIGQRAKQAEIVLYGKVLKSPVKWQLSKNTLLPKLVKKDGIYRVEIEVYCIFKGPSLTQFVNITKFGYRPSYCVDNQAIEGEKGIFFVAYGDYAELVAQKVNVQKSLAQATEKNLLQVMKATHSILQSPRGPVTKDGASESCPVVGLYRN